MQWEELTNSCVLIIGPFHIAKIWNHWRWDGNEWKNDTWKASIFGNEADKQWNSKEEAKDATMNALCQLFRNLQWRTS